MFIEKPHRHKCKQSIQLLQNVRKFFANFHYCIYVHIIHITYELQLHIIYMQLYYMYHIKDIIPSFG